MVRKMRRFKQQLSEENAKNVLSEGTNGILSLVDPDGEPYGVPLNFVFDGDKTIYFHSAVAGHKLDCIVSNPHCSFCVVGQDMIVPEKFTSYFRSVIVTGQISVVTDTDEVLKGLLLLCKKYSPGIDSDSEISKCLSRVKVLRMSIDNLTGKEAIELVKKDLNDDKNQERH